MGIWTPRAANIQHSVSKVLTGLALQKALEYPDGSGPRLLPFLNMSYIQKSHLPQIGWHLTHTCVNTKHTYALAHYNRERKGMGRLKLLPPMPDLSEAMLIACISARFFFSLEMVVLALV